VRRGRLEGRVAVVTGAGTEAQLIAAARACPAGAVLLFDSETGEEIDP